MPIKRAEKIFWFGDFNFRIKKKMESKSLKIKLKNKLFRNTFNYQTLLKYDQLNIERNKG